MGFVLEFLVYTKGVFSKIMGNFSWRLLKRSEYKIGKSIAAWRRSSSRSQARLGLSLPGVLVTGALVISGASGASATESSVVNIPDAGLRACVNHKLGQFPNAPISSFQALTITAATGGLSCSEMDISDLSGLERFINLTEIDLGKNRITNLSPLSGLKRLRLLDLGENAITDVSPLRARVLLTCACRGECVVPFSVPIVTA